MHNTIPTYSLKSFILGFLFLGFSQTAFGQKPLLWFTLQQTTYEVTESGGALGNYRPRFPESVTAYDGQEVVIQGFIIPMDVGENAYVLSMNPFSSCFFCGNAGPETVMELKFKDPQSKFLTDQFIRVKGVLRLNRYNSNGFFYTLENAESNG
ncbi:MAG: hypothetical protein SchgKO_17870 [Schleiferiaceae bacterium]